MPQQVYDISLLWAEAALHTSPLDVLEPDSRAPFLVGREGLVRQHRPWLAVE